MKKILFLIMLCVYAISAYSQGGIVFTDNSYEELLKQAKLEGKHVFIDMYTEWCGPCKSMSKKVFPDPKAGEYYNKTFINAKINAEKEGVELARKFKVSSYPTLLYISSDGELIMKAVGMRSAEQLIVDGKNAITALVEGDLISNLDANYEKNKGNELFLKKYIAKKIEQNESPVEAIDHYLGIQKEIKPEYFEMMEFLISHSKYLFCGGKGEELLLANMNEYLDIATRNEAKSLNQIPFNIIMQTQRMALKDKNVSLYELFLDRWMNSPNKNQFQNIADYRLQLLELKNDKDGFVKLGSLYLDSIQSAYSKERVVDEDLEYYNETCKRLSGGRGVIIDAIIDDSKNVRTRVIQNVFSAVGRKLLSINQSKKNSKKVIQWVDYALSLDTSRNDLKNLKADALKLQGKKNESNNLKKEIIDSLPENDVLRLQLQKELTL